VSDKPRRWYLSACGLDCGTCTIHLRTREELDFWKSKNVDPEKIRCNGCRSERREGEHWSADCKLLACCVDRKGLGFCAQCEEFDSCALIREFAESCEHHREAVARLREMHQTGVESWLARQGFAT
jgi:hypothetical protein